MAIVRLLSASLTALVFLLCACGEDERATAPPAPGGGQGRGGYKGPTGTTRDAGRASFEDDDAGVVLDDATLDCDNVEEKPFLGEDSMPGMLLNATGAPDDFIVTRVAIGFEGDCDRPAVILSMGGGRCPDGDGHELVFAIDSQAIEGGLVGQYTLGASGGDERVQIRYHRPERHRRAGMFGCGDASGTIDFTAGLGLSDGDRFVGKYDLTLPPCSETVADPETVRGSFALELKHDVEDACQAQP